MWSSRGTLRRISRGVDMQDLDVQAETETLSHTRRGTVS